MKNLILTTIMMFSVCNSYSAPTVKPVASPALKKVTGVISHYEPMENSALISLVGASLVYNIKNLTQFSEEKLSKIFSSMSEGAPIVLVIKGENEVVDIESPVNF